MKALVAAMLLVLLTASAATALWEPVPYPGEFENIQFFISEDRLYAAGSASKIYGSTDYGDTWVEIAGGLNEVYAPIWSAVIVDDWFIMSRDFFETFNYRSRRIEGEWQPWEALPVQDGRVGDLTAIGSNVFGIFTGGEIRRSDDYGWTWTPVDVSGAQEIWRIFAVEGRLFASENEINAGTIYRSDDLGETWVEVGQSLGSSYLCSQIHWQSRLLLCVYHMGGIGTFWSSEDFGDNWEQITTLPTPYNINGLATAQDGRLAIGASGSYQNSSIWLSGDLVEWEDYTSDLPQAARPFNDLISHNGWFFKTGGTVTAYRAPHPEISGVGEGPADTFATRLTAWPNPFNPATTLRLILNDAGPVQLGLFDLAGRQVVDVFDGEMTAGPHEFTLQARDPSGRPLPAGVYFVRVVTAAEQAVRRIVMVR